MIVDVAAGDRATELVVALYQQHRVEVYAYLCRLVHDRQWAEDLAQETFLRALGERQSLLQVQNPRAWLYRVATNLALNALKRRRRFAWLPWQAADSSGAGSTIEAIDRHNALEAALATLPPSYRAPLLLYAHFGLSVAEVAEALGLSAVAAKTRLCRAREMFRQAYDERGTR